MVDLKYFRETLYVVQSDPVKVAPEAIDSDVSGDVITLNGLFEGFETGRWIIVAGERTDIIGAADAAIPGVRAAELRTISNVEEVPEEGSPGDTPHTRITLDKPLAYSYKRGTVTVYGNVVVASHGETVANEILGSGNSAVRKPRFQLKRSPLTYVGAVTTSGIEGTETVRVNKVRYHRVESLLDAAAGKRIYELDEDGNGTATVTFGAPLPGGQDNVRVSYRTGIGREGNVKAEQISLLVSRPLGVQGVTNPLRAHGGADPDRAERIRRNAPLATLSLGSGARLVSVSDYASFALRFAGIGHAEARKLTGDWVLVTVAGLDDIPLDDDGPLLKALEEAYHEFGDPVLQVAIVRRELKSLVLQARVIVDPEFELDDTELRIRRRLLDALSFDRSALGKSVYLSDVVSTIQAEPGVDWVDVDVFGGVAESELLDDEALAIAVKDMGARSRVYCALGGLARDDPDRAKVWKSAYDVEPYFLPSQLAYLVPEVPRTLALNLSWR